MITISMSPFDTNWSKNRLCPLFLMICLLSNTILLFSPTQTIESILPTCHSFSITHQRSTKSKSESRSLSSLSLSFTKQTLLPTDATPTPAPIPPTRQRITAIFSEARNNNEEYDFTGASVEEIQQHLVRKGLAFRQTSLDEEPSMTRVPGCVATVYVVAKAKEQEQDDEGTTTGRISLYGNADAIVSRGLLSVLADHLEQLTLDQVLELDPEGVADVLGLRPALGKGRNDGLANMLRIIQNQLQNNNDSDVGIGIGIGSGSETKETTTDSDEQTDLSSPSPSPTLETKPTVALLLSGGVDSSVAFRLLLEQGYDVVPFYLKIWLEDELAHLGECPWEADVNICREVCDQVGIELQIISLQEEYHQRVMQHTLNECSLGRTPNPDILCNSRVKFGCFLEYLKGLPNQFDYIASGHYAQVKRTTDGESASAGTIARLFRAPDPVKDQSYFLCALNQSQLSRLLFPIGHLEKTQVRELAEAFRLPNRHRPDSQGLCFLGKVKFRDFMQIHLGEKPGDIVDAVTGETIGEHHGVWYHTVGQRKGIGPYLEPKASSKGPWYVVAKDPSQNIVFASNRYDEDVFVQSRSEFHVESIGWITGSEPTHLLSGNDDDNVDNDNDNVYHFVLKIRHGPKLATGTLEILGGDDRDGGIVRLDAKDGGLAPGQYVVFYTEDAECLGGGIISERHWARFLLDRENEDRAGGGVLAAEQQQQQQQQ